MIPHRSEIDGNNLVIHGIESYMLMHVIEYLGATQFTAVIDGKDDDCTTLRVTFPINDFISHEYKAMIHRARSKNRLGKDGRNPDDDGPKGPGPTNPLGSGGKVVQLENVMAVAA